MIPIIQEPSVTLPPPSSSGTSSTGLDPNVAGALAYLLGPLTGILFLVLEKENRFVRYHAAHSIAVGIVLIIASVALAILSGVLAFIPFLGWLVATLLSVVLGFGSLVLWLLLMWQAFQGREWSLPIAGPIANRIVGVA
ncbi:MAG TPA: DUF4870 domain-containing protein [Gemmatimonadaceae bacterium]|nr:DUF4870 domain-containing protein [Gemmatimonadaceae bacterium]